MSMTERGMSPRDRLEWSEWVRQQDEKSDWDAGVDWDEIYDE